MVDVLLHHIQVELQQGHSLQVNSHYVVILSYTSVDQYLFFYHISYSFPLQDLLLKACASLVFFVWTNELLPLDILLLALIDRDDDPHALRIVVCTF